MTVTVFALGLTELWLSQGRCLLWSKAVTEGRSVIFNSIQTVLTLSVWSAWVLDAEGKSCVAWSKAGRSALLVTVYKHCMYGLSVCGVCVGVGLPGTSGFLESAHMSRVSANQEHSTRTRVSEAGEAASKAGAANSGQRVRHWCHRSI